LGTDGLVKGFFENYSFSSAKYGIVFLIVIAFGSGIEEIHFGLGPEGG
jgi:hypothetical protein